MRLLITASLLLFVTSLFSVAQSPHRVDWEYHFPLDINPAVSGSFGEIRSNHFHSGLDLATQGKTGWPVYAADDGFVSRVVVSPVGFGKAVYIDHPSGYTTVYAHLERFNAKLDSMVTALQYRQESFALQHYFKPETFPVKRGEVIARSGNSGSSGGPHLHFEVRETLTERPIDPLFFPTPVMDDVRPQIKGIQLYPLSPGATINGESSPQYFPAVFYNGRFHLKSNPRISASGTIGVGIEVLDYYTGSWRKCGVHSIVLRQDESLAFQFKMDGFLFSETRYLNSHIDYAAKVTRGRTIQKSFLDAFNLLNLYQTNADRGRIKMQPGVQTQFSYEVKDVSGNASLMTFNVWGIAPVQPAAMEQFLSKEPVIIAGQPYTFEQEGYELFFPADCFYDDVPASFQIQENNMALQGKVITVLDETVPMHTFFKIKIPLADDTDTKGLTGVLISKKGEMTTTGGGIEGTHFVIRAREGGVYGLARDTIPPSIRLVGKPADLNYRGRESLVVHVKDDFSGIASYRCTINGKWALFEYDAKNNRLKCQFNKVPYLTKGEHRLEILVTDNVGNEERLTAVFKY